MVNLLFLATVVRQGHLGGLCGQLVAWGGLWLPGESRGRRLISRLQTKGREEVMGREDRGSFGPFGLCVPVK